MIRSHAVALTTAIALAACGPTTHLTSDVPSTETPDADITPAELRSTAPRAPAMPQDLPALAEGHADFGFALHRAAAPASGNTVMSPHSVAVALAMARAGAVGATGTEMDAALRFSLPGDRLHAAFNAMGLALAARPAEATAADPEPAVPRPALLLRVVNDVWAQRGLSLVPAYLDALATWYGAGVRVLDFTASPDPSRRAINAWISQQTERRIPELIPAGAIDASTRLVLTNAVYFNARWRHRFNPDYTRDEPFTRVDGSAVTARMMTHSGVERLPYAEGEGWRAVELPYVGDGLAMLLVVPNEGTSAAFERSLDGPRYRAIVAALEERAVIVRLPRFSTRLAVMLRGALTSMGMRAAFSASADFSGITRATPLVIAEVIHEGFIDVTEAGTEAAAATAVVFADGGIGPVPPVSLVVNRPFYYVIRDRGTGAVLFLGRVVDPTR